MKQAGRTTERHKRVLDAMVGNGRERAKTKAQALREADYSEAVIQQPAKVFNSLGFRRIAEPLIKRLEIERERALVLMSKKIAKATYRDLADSVDKLTKNIQLLSGGATETALTISISAEVAQKNAIPANQPAEQENAPQGQIEA